MQKKLIFTSIDEYIMAFPKDVQKKLMQLRVLIRREVPQADEKISYQMPAFFLEGVLVWFAAHANHIGFYPKASAIAKYKLELSRFRHSKGAVQFPLDQPLPLTLIRRMVKFRVAENGKGKQQSQTEICMSQQVRQHFSSGSPFEPKLGISRAVRSGRFIAVSGTAPLGPDGKTVGVGDPARQSRRCLEIIQTAIIGMGGKLSDIIRTRILLTRIDDWNEVALVHGEFFKDIRPVNTTMQVGRFIDPDWLVEIEADAIVDE